MNKNSDSFSPGFMVLHGNRLEDLCHLLIEVLKTYRLPVLCPETILVQNNGMKHWLEMALASDDAFGICAATRIELPSSYLWGIYRKVLSDVQIPVHMPFDKKNLTWRLYKILPTLIEKPTFQPLRKYIGESPDSRRLYQLANQISDVFDGYQNYRADWLMDWANGDDQLISDGYLKNPSKPLLLGQDDMWQSELWRELRADIGPILANASRANVHAQFLEKMKLVVEEFRRTREKPEGMPQRVVIFGISSLPPQIIEAFAKLGEICQVFMFVQNPCQSYWGDIVDGNEMLRALARRRLPTNPRDLHMSSHPLLASWGKQGRDYFHLLDDFDNVDSYKSKLHKVEVFNDPINDENLEHSQLAHVQSSILNLNSAPGGVSKLSKSATDHSIQFISVHSAQREIEVLHDQLHSWFDRDSEIRPEHIMVMVPEMETFLAHIKAVFGRFSNADARFIPFSIADTTTKETPIVRALTQLLSTPSLKVSLIDWLNLFEVDAVCKKFDVSIPELEQLRTWLLGSGVRWGLNGDHRVQHGMDKSLKDLDQNTWAFGLRRILLGYALGNQQSWESTLAYPGVNGLDGPLISKLLIWIDAIENINTTLNQEHTPNEWVIIFKDILELFFKACNDAQERLLEKIFEPLEQWRKICSECELTQKIPLHVVRDYWLNQLEEVGLQQRFFGGGVQFGTLMPMRSIPFKIICLLGMNDGDFPRQTSSKDFDLMSRNWRTGDRSRREDDRYLFLEALLCARKKLYISWQGHSARDNSEKPPSVLVAQLIDFLNDSWDNKVEPIKYPLQPFSKKYFERGGEFITYDKDWEPSQLQGKELIGAKPSSSTSVQQGLLEHHIQLSPQDIHRLLRRPVEIFFRNRLNITIDTLDEEMSEAEPFALNHLEEYKISDELLKIENVELGMRNLKLSGRLPMQGYGVHASQRIQKRVQDVLQQRDKWTTQYPQDCDPITISLQLEGASIEGALLKLRAKPISGSNELDYLQLVQRVGAVSEKIKDYRFPRGDIVAQLWVNHLLASAQGHRVKSVQLGSDAQIVIDPMDPVDALEVLQKLVGLFKQAWERPIPVACKTGWIWLQSEIYNSAIEPGDSTEELENSHENAEKVFEPSFHRDGERNESAYLIRAFEDYDALRSELPALAQALYGDMAHAARVIGSAGPTT
jgi:exodeoxyribonuclease V gamma subunit